ncbi:MAG: lasso peptide biosynthesis B2 protein [Gemmatimonadales bacterium]
MATRAVSAPVQGRSVKVPSVLRSGFTIFAVKMSLKIRGYGRTIRWIQREVRGVPADASADADVVKAAEHAVAMAGALYPGRALCLEQSLVLYYLLRRQGVAVRYCQGVQPYPFEGHAWIEYRGEPINDVGEHVKLFARLPDLLP